MIDHASCSAPAVLAAPGLKVSARPAVGLLARCSAGVALSPRLLAMPAAQVGSSSEANESLMRTGSQAAMRWSVANKKVKLGVKLAKPMKARPPSLIARFKLTTKTLIEQGIEEGPQRDREDTLAVSAGLRQASSKRLVQFPV